MPTPNNNTNTPTVNANSEPQPEQTEQFKLAFEQLAAERAALDEESIVRINVDVPSTVNLVFAHLPQIGALASEVKALPSFDFARFEKLETYAQALAFAQMLHNAASKPIEHVPEMAAVVAAVRERLVADVSALATRGLMDGTPLSQLKGGTGYKAIAYDVGTLVAMLRASWSKVEGKTAVSADELMAAQVHSERLLMAVAAREQQEIDVSAAAEQRQRAFTLLAGVYEQVRRAVSFLRWGDDMDEIAPSFYNGRGNRKRAEEPVVAPAPAAPTTPTNGNGSSTTVSAPSGGNGVGLPGASPYAGG